MLHHTAYGLRLDFIDFLLVVVLSVYSLCNSFLSYTSTMIFILHVYCAMTLQSDYPSAIRSLLPHLSVVFLIP